MRVINKSIVHSSPLVKPTFQSRFKMTNISQFSIETKVYLNDFLSDIFKNLNADNQMSQSSGQDEPLGCPKNAFLAV